ncbi:unnamed protein product [Alternaria alternata]
MGEAPITPPSSSSQRAPPPLPRTISPSITLQPPLSRRGKGPGLVLVLDHYAAREAKDGCLDPPPLQKWAEEGFAVVQLLVPGKVEDGGEFPLQKALEALKNCKGCEFSNGVGLISYLSRTPYYVEEAAGSTPDIKALVSYGGGKFTTIGSTPLPPQLIHIAGLPDTRRRESCSLVPGPSSEDTTPLPENVIKSYRYEDAKKESGWVLPSDEDYHKRSAGIAHTRSLTFLKPLLGGPFFDLEAVWEEHTKFEFGERDVAKTMATMVDQPYVNHIPTMTNPPDTALSLVSRTVGIDRVIDEFIFTLTHTREVPWLLPGIPPTGRPLAIPFTSVVAMRGDRLCHEHISWDHATVLKQLGLLPEYVPFPFEIEGEARPEGKRYEVKLPVVGMEGSRKLVDESCEESNALMGELVAWTEAIPEEAVQYDFLMDGLLAMASLHFAFYNPDSRRQYTEFAIRYQNEGLQKYNDTLGDINDTNCTALFAFSILINVMAIALPNADPSSANSAHTESLMTTLELGQGIGIIHSKSVTLLTNGKLGSFFRPSPGDLDPDDETKAALEKLRQHTDSLLHSNSIDEERHAVYASGIRCLGVVFGYMTSSNHLGRVIGWPAMIWPEEHREALMRLIRNGDIMALTIFMHYGVLLLHIRHLWWGARTGISLIEDLAISVHAAGPSWGALTEWPRGVARRIEDGGRGAFQFDDSLPGRLA